MSPPRVLILQPIHKAGTDALAEAGIEFVNAPDARRETLLALIGEADGLIVRTTGYRIDAEVMDRAPRLRVIGRHGVGVDHIDVRAAHDRGIVVVNTPEANSQGVAEYTVGLMLSLRRRLIDADRAVRTGKWTQRERLVGGELFGHTLGIIGLGRIGSRVGRIAKAGFQMRVLYFDIVRKHEEERALGVEFASFDEVVSQADILTLHTPLTPLTRNMMNARTIARMKPGACLVNASRGEVVEFDALVAALRSGQVSGAGLDVFPEEPPDAAHPILSLPNVVVSPHMASHSGESMVRMSLVAEDVVRVLSGKQPRNPVAPEAAA